MSTAGTSDQVRIVHWIASTRAHTSMTGKDDWQKEIIRALRQSFQRVKRDVQVAHVIHASLAPLDAHFGPPVNSIACDPPFVTTLQGEVHEAVVEQAVAQLEAYAAANRGVFRTFGGSMTFGANGTRGNSRAPDGGFRPDGSSDNEDPVRPRIIVEVEVHHRGVPEPHRFCLEYFDLIPQLRAVLLLKIFPRRADGTFACLAILYDDVRRCQGLLMW